MSLVLRTIQAFPRGRSTEEILVLVGAGFSHEKRVAALTELSELLTAGRVEKGNDGLWRPKKSYGGSSDIRGLASSNPLSTNNAELISASPASFYMASVAQQPDESDEENDGAVEPQALLRYWRSALRADPRGATTQASDKHGFEWNLISGPGPMVPGPDETLTISVSLEKLTPSFREALVKREANENTLAIGWPISVGRRSGVPVFRPVGLLAARWERTGEKLILTVETDDILVNPDWIKAAATESGWNKEALNALFDAADGVGLPTAEFLARLRDSVARQIRGHIKGADLASQLDANSQGIFDSAGIFLPTDSTFTANAARDLDTIATWEEERLARTALAPILGLEAANNETHFSPINVGAINGEQLAAIRYACSTPLSVVTGPPGTGKSQAIVSMAASVLLSGGSVLVASKNHQALDAVEDRLGALAPETPFIARTLDPQKNLDFGFVDALKDLIERDGVGHVSDTDPLMFDELFEAARKRNRAVDAISLAHQIQCKISELLELIEFRETRLQLRPDNDDATPTSKPEQISLIARLLRLISLLLGRGAEKVLAKGSDARTTLSDLKKRLEKLRSSLENLDTTENPVPLGDEIQALVGKLLPKHIAQVTNVGVQRCQQLADAHSDWEFEGGKGHLPTELTRAVVTHRPLWLASVLGAPRRIPLEDALFDLVIFDEASQCDIATAIPLFARAKRAVVVGDDQQLSFIPQLGLAQDRNLMQTQGLPLARMGRFAQSRRSLFDFASRTPNVARVILRHQYRSAGPIVEYISSTFYGDQLQTSYDPTTLVVPKNAKPGLAWEHVPAPAIPQNGNVNPNEVAAIVAHLRKLLIEEGYKGSIGIITPFRAQVMAIQQAVNKEISEPRQQLAELKIATVDSFQGQERDLILFSPCVGPNSPNSGLTFFVRDTRRLNVAISRARAVAITFGDLHFARSGKSSALQRLAARCTEPIKRTGDDVFDSEWERRLYHALLNRGLEPKPQFEIAGRRLDFALFGPGEIKLDLEVDGRRWHQTIDGKRKTSDLWRDHQLQSLGWRVRRFWVDELSRDMEGCLDTIERDLS